MVVLNNVLDVNELKMSMFKSVSCPCELCNCGCFERNKHEHTSGCKGKGRKMKEAQDRQNQSKCALTHYRDTFKQHSVRPPTVMLPLPEKYVRQVPMDLQTSQKAEYKPVLNYERRQAFRLDENTFKAPTEPFHTVSSYKNDYASGMANKTKIVHRNPNEVTMSLGNGKMSDQTTFKDHFRQLSKSVTGTYGHHNSLQQLPYFEMPSIAGNMIFPTKERHFTTTTSSVHKQMEPTPRTKPFIPQENDVAKLNKTFGKMDGDTVYRDTYVVHENAKKADIIRPKRSKSTLLTRTFDHTTQTKEDFVSYGEQYPTQKVPNDFYSSNLNREIYPDNIHVLSTIYNSEFPGYDPRKNPRPKAFKSEEVYKKPTEEIDLETVTMREFKPLDMTKIPKITAYKVNNSDRYQKPPMQSETTMKANFINYTQPRTSAGSPRIRQLASDLNDKQHMFIKPKQTFNAITTNSEQFYPKQPEKSINFKPVSQASVNEDAGTDTSAYRNEYKNHGLTMCGAKAYFLAKALDEKRMQ